MTSRIFSFSKLFRLSGYYERCLPLLLVSQIFPLSICFSSPSALFMCPKIVVVFFLMVLSRDRLYPTISITSLFDSFLVHDIHIIFLMYHISADSSLFFLGLLSVSSIHIHAEGWIICRLSECCFWCKF